VIVTLTGVLAVVGLTAAVAALCGAPVGAAALVGFAAGACVGATVATGAVVGAGAAGVGDEHAASTNTNPIVTKTSPANFLYTRFLLEPIVDTIVKQLYRIGKELQGVCILQSDPETRV
jgi:hypothetical protein